MLKLKIPSNIFKQMLQQAKAEAPIEACGILAGRDGQIERRYKMTNSEQSSNHFMMAPEEQFKVVKDIRAAGLEMLAIYHSHPETPARPSEEDIKMALTPEVAHVIVSVQDPAEPDIQAFRIKDGFVTTIPVKIMKG